MEEGWLKYLAILSLLMMVFFVMWMLADGIRVHNPGPVQNERSQALVG